MTTTSLLRLPAVRVRTGLSRTSIYARVAAGTFPRPIHIGPRAVAWPSDVIDAWIGDRIRESHVVQPTPTGPASVRARAGRR
jgi:prophage regulatory protein